MLIPLWFLILAVLWIGFFVLEGFDFGVGALHGLVGRDEEERATVMSTVGPLWDANEVWLIVAVAGTFAAFPLWYSTLFSATYLLTFVIIFGLIVRGVAIVYVERATTPRWQRIARYSLVAGSVISPFVLGLVLGDQLDGLPINAHHTYTGNFGDLFTGYGIWCGITLVALSLLHGATFLGLRTTGELRLRSRRLATVLGWPALAITIGFAVWTQVQSSRGIDPGAIQWLAILSVIAALWLSTTDLDGWAFASSTVAIGSVVASVFIYLYPHVLVSSTNVANSLTASNSAAGDYSLRVMTVIALILLPLVLGYQAWTYYVFRQRVTGSAGSGYGSGASGPSSGGPAASASRGGGSEVSAPSGGGSGVPPPVDPL